MRAGFAAIALLCGSLFANAANADDVYFGHCTDDESVPAESILAACTGVITQAYAENWNVGFIPYARVYEAHAFARLGRDDDAEKTLTAAVRRYPDFPFAWERLGELLERQKGAGMLMMTMDAMIKANPDNPTVLNEACWVRAKAGEQLDAAIADCTESLRLSPADANTLDSRAYAYFRNLKYAEAIADANAALAINPKLASSLYVRGLAKLKSGDPTGGNADLAAAKAIDGKIADAYQGLRQTP